MATRKITKATRPATRKKSSKKPRKLREHVAKLSPSSLWGYAKYNKTLTAFFALVFVGIGVFVIYRSFAAVPQGTYTDWSWQSSAGGFNSMEHTLTIESSIANAKYYWAHQFGFEGGDGGYIGLQSNGGRVNGSQGKTAVFSVFGAGIAGDPQVNCSVEQAGFDGYDKSGTSCRIPYEWTNGTAYRIKVSRLTQDRTGIWWVGTINGAEIARIKVPLTWGGVKAYSIMWTEYFGDQPATCSAIPYSRVRFSQPRANDSSVPTSFNNHTATGADCSNSKITSSGSDQIHEVGIPSLPAPPGPKDCKADGTCPRCTITVTKSGSTWTARWNSFNLGTAKYGWGATLLNSANGAGPTTGLPVNGSRTVGPVPGVDNAYFLNIYDGWEQKVGCAAVVKPAAPPPPPPPPPPPAAYCTISVAKNSSGTWIGSWSTYNLGAAQYGWDATLTNSATGNTTNNVGITSSRTLVPRVGYNNTYTLKIYDGWAATSTQCSITVKG